jgi:hypothetical protein
MQKAFEGTEYAETGMEFSASALYNATGALNLEASALRAASEPSRALRQFPFYP